VMPNNPGDETMPRSTTRILLALLVPQAAERADHDRGLGGCPGAQVDRAIPLPAVE